ncbi:hypothetical protein RQP46_003327 [Phenoliferia psychrophenolica]
MRLKQPMTLAVALAILEFTSATASVGPRSSDHASLAKRRHHQERTTVQESSDSLTERSELDERGLFSDISAEISSFLHGGSVSSTRCPQTFTCNGLGTDGYSYDTTGASAPSGCSGWKYFGTSVGWQPPSGWNVPALWSPPSFWSGTCSKATWWTASSSWRHPVGFSIPSFWINNGFRSWEWPSKSWSCNSKGTDGLSWDWQGNTLPTGYPSGWLWYGLSIGWQPPSGWKCADNWIPPTSWYGQCSLATWWTPPATWSLPSGLSAPAFWPSRLPSISWTCAGTGLDGKTLNHLGASCPSQYPSGWLWFGTSIGWAPPASWKVPSISWAPSSACIGGISGATWWAPSSAWLPPSTFTIPSFWSGLGWSSPYPASSWTCNKSGLDGKTFDHLGNLCPSQYPSSWLWFGVSIGWQPASGWTAPAAFVPPTAWLSTCSGATWWSPPSSYQWTLPSTFTIPSFWPPVLSATSWKCSGSGSDGKTLTDQGLSLPSQYPSGWLWFGTSIGWAPPLSWSVPSTTWSPSSACIGGISGATWWAPSSSWLPPSTFTIPSFWSGLGWTSPYPPADWNGDKSGLDGNAHDHMGNPCPSQYPTGWLWFGFDHSGATCPYSGISWKWFGPGYGWLPPHG